jgi:hypothetical protein
MQLRSRIDASLRGLSAIYDEEAKRVDKKAEDWKAFERQNANNMDRVHIARLNQHVLENEKLCYSLDLNSTRSTFELFYVALEALLSVAESIDKELANTMEKEEAQSVIKAEVESVGKFILRRINAKQEAARRRWIQGNLGNARPK